MVKVLFLLACCIPNVHACTRTHTHAQVVDPISPKGLRVVYDTLGKEATATSMTEGEEDPATIYMQVRDALNGACCMLC